MTQENSIPVDFCKQFQEYNWEDMPTNDIHGHHYISVKQLGSNQDFVQCGTTEFLKWIVVCDGHGSNCVIDIIRKYDFHDMLKKFDASLHSSEEFHKFAFEKVG